jgi:DNA-damage-inducible protein D
MFDHTGLSKTTELSFSLEDSKRFDHEDIEYWSARELQKALGYSKWKAFKNVLRKAQIACQKSGQDISEHFMRATKILKAGFYEKREIEDVHLTRYACYLVLQNANPRKKPVAIGQTYLAIQTYRQLFHIAE